MQHVFSTKVAPRLAFIGLPFNVVAFHLFQMQAKWVARVLAGRCLLSPKVRSRSLLRCALAVEGERGSLEAAAPPPFALRPHC